MFFAARALLRLLYLSLFRRRDFPPTQRTSLVFCLKFFAIFPLIELVNAVCLLLDEVFFPGCRRASIKEPIFVIGNPRSGTTILHRVLAADERRFFCFRTWEILFPSVLQKKIVAGLGRLDRLTGGHLRALMPRPGASRFTQFQHIHQVGLFLPEEDDKLLIHILASHDLGWFFPYGGFDRLVRFDVAVDARDQRRIMDFYLRCVRRQAYFKGGRRTFLSKNPAFSGKAATLMRYFRDCKIIYLVRNPLDVVPSTISLARALVNSGMTGVEPDPHLDEKAYETIRFYYTYPLDLISALPQDRCIVVNYEDLIRQPRAVIERIYRQFGFELTREFAQRLDQEAMKMERHQSHHEYSLEHSSVTRERIVADLRPIFDRFAFDTREATCSAPRTSRAR